ncbi:MAG: hypothetical protein NTW03_16035, partial [Verrucomicrobia bacterium]|nr:hypothetical protein [Verrucomicrobiota bacterium]
GEIAAIYQAGGSGFCSTNSNVPTLPDLAVSSIFAPADATIVQTAVLTFTMTNQGGSAAFGPWVNEFSLATTPDESGAQAIGSATFNGEIVAGGSITLTQAVFVPVGAFGPHFFGVRIDRAGNVAEANKTNNTAYASTTFIHAPDLQISAITGPASAIIGQTVPFVFTLTNAGDAIAPAPWWNQLLIAADTNGSGAIGLGAPPFTSNLSPGVSVSVTQMVSLPSSISGLWFFGVTADSGDDVAESDEGNNLAYSATAIAIAAPDLWVAQVSSSAIAIIGQTAQIAFTITNSGNAAAVGPWWNQFLVASDVNGSGAQLLGSASFTNSIAPGSSATLTQTVTLPNNISDAALPVAISAPDLTVAQVSPPASALMGQVIQLVFTLTNGGDATAKAPWQNQVYLANDTSGHGAQALGSALVTNALAAGGSASVTQAVTLPANRSGSLYLGVYADSGNNVPESNEANNLTYASMAIQINAPDLVPTQISGPASAIVGQVVPVVFTITNSGTTPAAGPWLNQILLAADLNGGGAQSLGTAAITNTLASGDSVTVTQMVTLPSATLGPRYFGVMADSADNVPESNENNNTAYGPASILISGPDLAMVQVGVPGNAVFGQGFTVTFAVTNIGTAPAGASWNDQLYLSASADSLAGAIPLATI